MKQIFILSICIFTNLNLIFGLSAENILDGYSSTLNSEQTEVFPEKKWKTSNTTDVIPMKSFQIMGYLGVPQFRLLEDYITLRDCRINVFFSDYGNLAQVDAALNLAAQAGVKIVIRCPELINNTEATVRRYMNHPALAGYFVYDEPTWYYVYGKLYIDQVGEIVNRIKSVDNQHFCYVNMFPIYAREIDLGISNSYSPVTIQHYQEYVNQFTQKINSEFLSFDHYPITNAGLRNDWFQNLQIIVDKANQLGKPFWGFVMSTAHHVYPEPNINHIRLQAFTNLAYGAQGIQYFTYWTPLYDDSFSNKAPIKRDGSKYQPVYDAVQLVNAEILTLSGIFSGGKVIRIRHTGNIPVGTTGLDYLPNHITQLSTSGSSGAIISEIKNGNRMYIVIVNRDYLNTMHLNINVDSHVEIVDKYASVYDAPTINSLDVLPGDIKIFSYELNSMSGTYKVGVSETKPNFTSLGSAINTINNCEIIGDVTLEITSNLTETTPVSINYSGNRKITIKAANNINPTVTFNASIDGAAFQIKNTKQLVINGSNSSGNTRNMTFVQNNSSGNKIIELFGQSDNVIIKNLNLRFNAGVNNVMDRFAVCLNESNSSTQPDDFLLQNCLINNTSNQLSGGIKINGGAQRAIIEKNDIYSIGYPIQTIWASNMKFLDNNIYSYSTGDSYSLFMFIIRASGTLDISRNKMNLMKINTIKGHQFFGILCTAGNGIYNISNNFIKASPSIIGSISTPSSAFYAMQIEDNSIYNIYHNSMVISNNNYALNQACIKTISTALNPTLNIKNNIFANYSTSTNCKIFDFYNRSSLTSNYNDLIYSGSGGVSTQSQTLSSWRSSTGQDVNSVSQDINFVDMPNADLSLLSSYSTLMVPRLPSVLVDKFLNVRGVSTSMGAYEQGVGGMQNTLQNFTLNNELEKERTFFIMSTDYSIEIYLKKDSHIELYDIHGMLIDKTYARNIYKKNLKHGIYIVKVNNESTIFYKKL